MININFVNLCLFCFREYSVQKKTVITVITVLTVLPRFAIHHAKGFYRRKKRLYFIFYTRKRHKAQIASFSPQKAIFLVTKRQVIQLIQLLQFFFAHLFII